jgi:hypothetical protein
VSADKWKLRRAVLWMLSGCLRGRVKLVMLLELRQSLIEIYEVIEGNLEVELSEEVPSKKIIVFFQVINPLEDPSRETSRLADRQKTVAACRALQTSA